MTNIENLHLEHKFEKGEFDLIIFFFLAYMFYAFFF